MLIACAKCHRQYDVGTLEPGAKVRCYCGGLNVVPQPRVHDAAMQRCSSCGGELGPDERSCGYCGSEVTISDRGWGEACPECYARLVKGAKFCSSCGTPIQPQVVRKTSGQEKCPRCGAGLSVCEIQGGAFTECTGCGGVWLEERTFEQLTDQTEQKSAVASYFSSPDRRAGDAATPATRKFESDVRYLNCPVCGEMMNRKNFARCSGVIIDWCKGHGWWFDAHELEAILEFVAKGGMEKARKQEIEDGKRQARQARDKARQAAQAQGMMAGPGFGGHRFDTGPGLGDLLVGLLRALF